MAAYQNRIFATTNEVVYFKCTSSADITCCLSNTLLRVLGVQFLAQRQCVFDVCWCFEGTCRCLYIFFRFHSVYSGVTSARGERNIKIERQSVSYCMDGLGLLQARTLTTPLRTMQHSCSLLTAVLPVLLLLTKWSRVTLKPPF